MGGLTMPFYIDGVNLGLKSIGAVYFLVDPVVGTKPNLSLANVLSRFSCIIKP